MQVYVQHFTLFNHCWDIRMLVIVARCSRHWSEDFMTSSNAFHAFHRFADLQSWVFWKLTVEQYFKSLASKSNSRTSRTPFMDFLEYDPKEVRVLINFFFFSFRLADDKNPLMLPVRIFFAFLHSHSGFFYYFEMLSFFSSNNTPERVSSCQISSLLDMYFK